jgi:hypothetical protein
MSSVSHTASPEAIRHRLIRWTPACDPLEQHRHARRRRRQMRLAELPVPTTAVWTIDREELRLAADDAGF